MFVSIGRFFSLKFNKNGIRTIVWFDGFFDSMKTKLHRNEHNYTGNIVENNHLTLIRTGI